MIRNNKQISDSRFNSGKDFYNLDKENGEVIKYEELYDHEKY